MKPKSILLILAITLVTIFLFSTAFAQTVIKDPFPDISVNFEEPVQIDEELSRFENTRTGQSTRVRVLKQGTQNKQFVFIPYSALENGLIKLLVVASDLVGNRGTFPFEFVIDIEGPLIYIKSPNWIGVSNQTTFDLVIGTAYAQGTECKYKGTAVKNYDDPTLQNFVKTDTNEHTIFNYSVQENFPKNLFVICKDQRDRVFMRDFLLYSDLQNPTITAVSWNPDKVVEYDATFNDVRATMTVQTSEPVICKFSEQQMPYASMGRFPRFDESKKNFSAFSASNSILIRDELNQSGDRKTYVFYVQCEDRAGRKSNLKEARLEVDLTAGLRIKHITPEKATNNQIVTLNISTNKLGFCKFKGSLDRTYDYDTGIMSSTPAAIQRYHTKDIGALGTGTYTVTYYCVSYQAGFEETIEEDYSFTIDLNPPETPRINATPYSCGDEFKASFFANDSETGVDYYIWRLMEGARLLANGTTSSEEVTVTEDLDGNSFNLTTAATYKFVVSAVDKAGNIGQEASSVNIEYDDTGTSCDTAPPTITLTMSEYGDSAILDCQDDLSGCSLCNWGTAYVQPCNVSQPSYTPLTIPLLRTTIICYECWDNAGNTATGTRTMEIATEEAQQCLAGIDNDGDGYGERCSLGPDCDDTDPLLNLLCANGCIEDHDGDGYGLGCFLGNDCDGRNANLTTDCPNGCLSDNDGDQYGLGCDNGPDCDGTSSILQTICPNGCYDDNDGDSYGIDCPPGFDCNAEDSAQLSICATDCVQDTDADGYGVGCLNGFDCDGTDPSLFQGCTNNCLMDDDSDGYGLMCSLGNDCNGLDPRYSTSCINGCEIDNDGDEYGWHCDRGEDCDDTLFDTNIDCAATTNCIHDTDGDGFGLGCDQGADCNDFDPEISAAECFENCTFDFDCDAMPDEWEIEFGLNENLSNADEDPDADLIINIEEYRRGTHPLESDIVEEVEEDFDLDDDGVPDVCEDRYPFIMSKENPDDWFEDPDEDGLTNREECLFKSFACREGTDPEKADTDFDKFNDKEEIEAGTDPCDPESKPVTYMKNILLIIIGLLLIIGPTFYLVYKKYYLPLTAPAARPVARPAAKPAARPILRRPAPVRLRPAARKRAIPLSRERFLQWQEQKAKERSKLFEAFGPAPVREEKPGEVMHKIAIRPREAEEIMIKPRVREMLKKKRIPSAHIQRLSRVIEGEAFDRLTALSKDEFGHFERLATIIKQKEEQRRKLADDEVAKLANITKKIVPDKKKLKQVKKAMRMTDMESLDTLLTTKKSLDKFLKESKEKKKGAEEFDALDSLSRGEKADAFDALKALTAPDKVRKKAAVKIAEVAGAETKEDLFKAFSKMGREAHVDKDVFEIILSYLLKSGKITKRDVSELLFNLHDQGVLTKRDVSDVFFNLNIKQMGR